MTSTYIQFTAIGLVTSIDQMRLAKNWLLLGYYNKHWDIHRCGACVILYFWEKTGQWKVDDIENGYMDDESKMGIVMAVFLMN